MLSDEELQTYRNVGKIVAEVREHVRSMVKPGVALLNIAEAVEEMIKQKGAKPAFPCNVSLNQVAAHYSPPADDDSQVKEGDLVKIDIGAHIDGYIADTAVTIAIGAKVEMVQAVERALEEGIKAVKPGIDVGEIGKAIEDSAKALGFKPIQNLTGHSLSKWDLHAGITIPNVEPKDEKGQKLETEKLNVGDVIALEPFLTDGAGFVEDAPQAYIFRYLRDRPVRMRMTRELLNTINRSYSSLPFAERWLAKQMSKLRLELTLRELVGVGALHPYHILKERGDGFVAQAEHTVIVTESGCEVTTR
jgi:methionyl aminopeptidase